MNLVEFPDDKLAFEPNKVTAIVGKFSRTPNLKCPKDCPGRWHDDYGYYDSCSEKGHVEYPEYTSVTVGSKDFVINRPFHDVMLIITANLLDNNQTGELS